jgi:hypothetical protein
MAKLSKPQQQFLLLFTGTALGSFVGYLINQLPNIPDFPNKAQIVIGLVTLLTLISFFVAWKLARLDGEGSVDKPEEYAVQQSREKLLERLRKTWISGVLERSLYHEARVELVLKEVKDQKHETLPPGTRVIQKFDELGQGGTMLILGEPGSGKTTTLLELARDLLERAEQDVDVPLPVVLHLAAWNRRDCKKYSCLRFGRSQPEPQKIENWVVEELHNSPVIEDLTGKDRHYEIDRKVARYWLREQRLVLLLDGLDEVAPEQRQDCVKAIREFRQAYRLAKNLKKKFSIDEIDIFWIIKNSNNSAWHQKTQAVITILLLLGFAVMVNMHFLSSNKNIPTSGWSLYFSIFTLGVFFLGITDYIFASFVKPELKRFVITEKPLELMRAYILALRNVLTFDLYELDRGEIPGLLFIVLVSFVFSTQSLHYLQKLPQNVVHSLPTWLNISLLWFAHIFFCLLIGLAVTFFIRLLLHYLLRALLTKAGLLPWKYHQFLNWTCDRFILQKIGDSYIFIHPMLREHFAQMDIDAFIQWADAKPN